jgi:hypothetical protein
MTLDPMLSLAFTIQSNRGSYALLLGSGVSKGAVPSGWDILLQLIQQVAESKKQQPTDLLAWFEEETGEHAGYSMVLDQLTHTSTERVGLLKQFFESRLTEDGDSEDIQPTPAHRAIARLMKVGYVKVVITTNFDRLLERALEEIGAAPTVLATPEAMVGAAPLHQQSACIVKLHGDYLDPRFLNTGEELDSYPDGVNRLLDQVLGEYGLVIAGWSASWDPAQRSAIERSTARQYGAYWVEPGTPSEHAARLSAVLRAIPLISTADDLFVRLAETVEGITERERIHPLTVSVAVSNAKRYISGGDDIRLHDLMASTLSETHSRIGTWNFNDAGMDIRGIAGRIDGVLEIGMALVASAAFWGTDITDEYWMTALKEWANQPSMGGLSSMLSLRYYPATLILYAAGVAMMAKGRLLSLERMLRITIPVYTDGRQGPISSELSARRSLEGFVIASPRDVTSDHVFEQLAPILQEHLLLSPGEIEQAFERFELLVYLVTADSRSLNLAAFYRTAGRIRSSGSMMVPRVLPIVELDQASIDGIHPWLAAGLFDSDKDRFDRLLDEFLSFYSSVNPGDFGMPRIR